MKREERRAVTTAIDQFGADIAISLRNREVIDVPTRVRRRLDADAIIEACTACDLHLSHGTPLTPDWSPFKMARPGRIAVLGDAPTIEEHNAHELGRGPMYRTVDMMFHAAGISADRFTYLTTVFCTPLRINVKRGKITKTRIPPGRDHAKACEWNVTRALHAADVDYVMLLGGGATRAWRADLRLHDVAGKWFTWRNKWMVYPVEHPSIMLSGSMKGTEQVKWRHSIEQFALGVNDGIGLEGLSSRCIRDCNQVFYVWDDDGVPWCKEHFKPNKIERKDRAGKVLDTAQEKLL